MLRECRRHFGRVTESLIGGTSNRKPPVLRVLPDGSYLSELDGLKVRIIEVDLLLADTGSRIGDHYRAHHHAAGSPPLPGGRADWSVRDAAGAGGGRRRIAPARATEGESRLLVAFRCLGEGIARKPAAYLVMTGLRII